MYIFEKRKCPLREEIISNWFSFKKILVRMYETVRVIKNVNTPLAYTRKT